MATEPLTPTGVHPGGPTAEDVADVSPLLGGRGHNSDAHQSLLVEGVTCRWAVVTPASVTSVTDTFDKHAVSTRG
jgi:hypothetical protein